MNLLPLLAAGLLVVAALLPPEIHPAGRILTHLIAAASALTLVRGGRPLSRRVKVVLLLVLPLALASLLLAPGGRARGLDEAAAFAGFGLAILLGRRLAAGHEAARNLVIAMVATLGTLLAMQAIAQRYWAYPRAAAALRATESADADAYLVRLEQGRPSGPFSLPAALGGFLALSMPLTVVARRQAAGRGARWAATAAFALQSCALLLTRSLGGLLAAVVALGILAGMARPAFRGRVTMAAILVFAAVALLFVHGRRAEIGARPGGDPITLRLGNWEAAVRMMRAHPILGVGPGRFPVFYPRSMREGMNETQYAHNSYLQLMATWGAWAIVPLGVLVAAALRRRREAEHGAVIASRAAGFGFLAHNVIDFTFFLPGVALPAGLLLGFSAPAEAPEPGPGSSAPARARDADAPLGGWGRILAGTTVALLLVAHAATSDRAALHLDRARTLAIAGRTEAAEQEARAAAAAFPLDPDPWAFTAQSLLARKAADPAATALRREAAERAVRLEPEAAILHHTLALDRALAADPAAAFVEERRAAQLFPAKPLYRSTGAEARP